MLKNKAHFHILTIPAMVFLFVGFVFMILGVANGISNAGLRENEAETTATIVGFRSKVIVEFTTKTDERIRTEIDQYMKSMQIGDQIQIRYSLEDPYEARSMDAVRQYTSMVCLIGLCFSWVGAAMVVFLLLKRKQGVKLRQNGRKLHVRIGKATLDRSIRINHKNPYLLIGTAQIEGRERQYRYRVFCDHGEMLVGKYLTVYYDPQDPSKYVVDAPEEI